MIHGAVFFSNWQATKDAPVALLYVREGHAPRPLW